MILSKLDTVQYEHFIKYFIKKIMNNLRIQSLKRFYQFDMMEKKSFYKRKIEISLTAVMCENRSLVLSLKIIPP